MGEILVKVENVSKKFCKDLKRSLWYGMQDLGKELIGQQHSKNGGLRQDEFWAVKNIDFELRRGECLGLIGRNGAGKTTLLRMLNGLIKLDAGRIEMRGRVGALIALGAGFNLILTGRENIYVNGAVLGLTKYQVAEKMDEIIEFADIADFINAPVQSYSSGMKVRLGFAVAAKLINPDVLFLDEVLAVGDIGFRAKCYAVISEMLNSAAVIFVSHAMSDISRLSTRVLLMEHGKTAFLGDPAAGVAQYNNRVGGSDIVKQSLGTGDANISNVHILDEHGKIITACEHGQPYSLVFDLEIAHAYHEYILSVKFTDASRNQVAEWHSKTNNITLSNNGEPQRHKIDFQAQLLNPGQYFLNIVVLDKKSMRHLCWEIGLLNFTVRGVYTGSSPIQLLGGYVQTPLLDRPARNN